MARYIFALLIAFACASATAVHAENDRRDGNYWLQLQPADKVTYTVGFFDGMDLGNKFSYWGSLNSKRNNASAGEAIKSYDQMSNTYFAHVTAGQLTAGLDSFYSDFQNRRILISDGVWLVLNQIAGTPAVNDMIVSFRRNTR